tara:strand:- start:195 stop:476 length:282 start_codon:yes stop_codon:yes gene_type:complete
MLVVAANIFLGQAIVFETMNLSSNLLFLRALMIFLQAKAGAIVKLRSLLVLGSKTMIYLCTQGSPSYIDKDALRLNPQHLKSAISPTKSTYER